MILRDVQWTAKAFPHKTEERQRGGWGVGVRTESESWGKTSVCGRCALSESSSAPICFFQEMRSKQKAEKSAARNSVHNVICQAVPEVRVM
jgi:hypothetical protein